MRVLEFGRVPVRKSGCTPTRLMSPILFLVAVRQDSTPPDRKTTETEARVGQAIWHEAETHARESTGTVHALLIELKK